MRTPLLALLAALASGSLAAQQADTATYSSEGLRRLLAEAASLNRRVPEGLGGYRAQLESEISYGNRRSEGQEMAVSIEQVASTLEWDRRGSYEQRIVGYRSQSIGVSFASIGFFRSGWAIPSLYGNRIALLFGRDTTAAARRRRERTKRDPVYAVHPLADDRERFYRFSGGDTVVSMRVGDRDLRIVRVEVGLRRDVPQKSVVFLGELDLDADRRHIVHMRGYFATVGGKKGRFDLLRDAGLVGIAFVEATNVEVDGAYWLPLEQRFEAHATSATLGEARAVFRILTRFTRRELLPGPDSVAIGSEGDTLEVRPYKLSVEPADTLSAYSRWHTDIGAATSTVSAEDFNDIAPGRWSADGRPLLTFETERLGDIVRVDRVQGVFTGGGLVYRLRDAAPGLTIRGTAGYAWYEKAVRGRGVIEYRHGRTQLSARVQRSLDLTNDFRSPFDSGSTIGALLGRDDYDYIDRRAIAGQLLRFIGKEQQGQLRIDGARVTDRGVSVHLVRSPLGFGDDFRAVRPSIDGWYWRTGATFDWRPDVALEFLRSGLGARLSYERGDGDVIKYQRAEARLTARMNRGPFALGARLDVGATNPDAPPQQFFELGENQNLPGYEYKEFAGDQAAVLRGQVLWRSGTLQAPIRLTSRFWLPAIAPAVAFGLQAGHVRNTTAQALATTALLGSATTRHPRASASLTLRFFGSAVGIGVARPIDHPGGWRFVAELGANP